MDTGGEISTPPQPLPTAAGVTVTSEGSSCTPSLSHPLTACKDHAGKTAWRVGVSTLSIDSILQDKTKEAPTSETDISAGQSIWCESAVQEGRLVAGECLNSSEDSKCDDSGICLNSSSTEVESVGSSGSGGHCARRAGLLPCDRDLSTSEEVADQAWANSAVLALDTADKEMACSSRASLSSIHSSAVGRGMSMIVDGGLRSGGDGMQLCTKQAAPTAMKVRSEVHDRISVEHSSKMPVEKRPGSGRKVSASGGSEDLPVGSGHLAGARASRKSCKGKGQLVNAISLRLKIKQSAKSAAMVATESRLESSFGEKQEDKATRPVLARLTGGGSEGVVDEKVSGDSKGLNCAAVSGFPAELNCTGGEHSSGSDCRASPSSCHNGVQPEESGISLGRSPSAALPPKPQGHGGEDSGSTDLKSACAENPSNVCTEEGNGVENPKPWPLCSDASSLDVPVEAAPLCNKNRRTSRRRSAGKKRKSSDFIDSPPEHSWDEACESSDVPVDAKPRKRQRSTRRRSAGINRRSADYGDMNWEREEKCSERKTKRRRRRRAPKANPSPPEPTDVAASDKYASRRGRRPANSSAINDASVMDPKSGKRMFPCPQCNKLFTRVEGVKIHLRIHTGEKPYSCEVCGKRFHESGGLRHHRNVHVGAKPHPCPYCKKSFTSNYGLHRHVRMHKGDDTYICSECGKTFGEASSLKVHRRIHSGDHPYTCSLCNKTFCQLGNYQSHMRIHTGERPYSCSVCGKSFRQSNVLQKHVRIHSGERPFACQRCGKAFNDSGHLQRHWRTHTGERPYQCSLCGKRFAQGAQIHRCETPDGKLFHEAGNGPFVFVGSRANRNGVPLTSLHPPDSKSVRRDSRDSQSPVQSMISSSQLQQPKSKFDANIPDDALFISGTDVAELDAKTSAEILQNDIFTPASKVSAFDDRLSSNIWDEGTSYEDSYTGSTEEEDDEINNNSLMGEDDEETAEDEEVVEEEEEDAENSVDAEDGVQDEESRPASEETTGLDDSSAGLD